MFGFVYIHIMKSKHYDNRKLQNARRAAGWTQRSLAEALNVAPNTIYRAEAGRDIGYDLLFEICQKCHVDIADILRASKTAEKIAA